MFPQCLPPSSLETFLVAEILVLDGLVLGLELRHFVIVGASSEPGTLSSSSVDSEARCSVGLRAASAVLFSQRRP